MRDPLVDEAIDLLHFGFHGAIGESVRRLRELGLTRMDHTLLYLAERMPGLTVGEFMQRYGATRQALTRPLHELVERQLLEQRPDAVDGRIKRLHLTREGERVLRSLNSAQQAAFERAFERAGKAAKDGWRAVMRELAAPAVDYAHARSAYIPPFEWAQRPEKTARARMSSGVELRVSHSDVAEQRRATSELSRPRRRR